MSSKSLINAFISSKIEFIQLIKIYSVIKPDKLWLNCDKMWHVVINSQKDKNKLIISIDTILFGTRKAEVLNSLIINTTAKANDTTDILQTFR